MLSQCQFILNKKSEFVLFSNVVLFAIANDVQSVFSKREGLAIVMLHGKSQ